MKILRATLAIAMVLAFSGVNAFAADKTVSVTASASIAGVTSMSITPASITYGNTGADAYPTNPVDEKVTITYASNYDPWKINIYTNNTTIPNKVGDTTGFGRYAKGGLKSTPVDHDGDPGTPTISKNVIACKWFAKNPTSGTPRPAATALGAYNFVKDLRDEDDPATGGGQNESWAGSGGYPVIAYGNAGGGVCVDPADTVEGTDGDGKYVGDPITGTIAVYIAGLFGTGGVTPPVAAPAGSYSSAINFDLYHE